MPVCLSGVPPCHKRLKIVSNLGGILTHLGLHFAKAKRMAVSTTCRPGITVGLSPCSLCSVKADLAEARGRMCCSQAKKYANVCSLFLSALLCHCPTKWNGKFFSLSEAIRDSQAAILLDPNTVRNMAPTYLHPCTSFMSRYSGISWSNMGKLGKQDGAALVQKLPIDGG